MIHTLPAVVDDTDHHGEEVTVRCTVHDGPQMGNRGGQKTMYEIDVSGCQFDGPAFLSCWHESPVWTDAFGATPEYVHDTLDNVPLQHGETVIARGVPNEHNDTWYFNVTSILIRDPETPIGKSEMRSANECPRIYNLKYEKQVFSPGRYDLSPGSVKGRIVHSLLEYAIDNPDYRDNFEHGWTEAEMDACFEDVLDSEYAVDLALCRLAWISPNDIKEHAWNAIEPLLTDDTFTDTINEAESVNTEVALSSSLGFNGRVDLVIDGTPYDLKTSYQPTDAQRNHHRFQLRIYLLALALETLEPGERLMDRIEDGVEGVLVYPNLADADGVELERVELRKHDLQAIMEMRNDAAVLRGGFGTPTTYGRDCTGCMFKEPTAISGDTDEQLPAPCQFYCQSERRWDCFETDEDGDIITQCPLFDECDQRLEFRNPAVTDHYNRLRTALNEERDARHALGTELEHLSRDSLIQAGLLLPQLELHTVEGQRRLRFTTDQPVVPAFRPGDKIRLYHADTEYYQTATYYGHDGEEIVFELDGQPNVAFLNPQATFEARRTVSTDTFPRDLLSQLDYAQRAEVTPLLETTGDAGDALAELSPEEPEQVATYLDNKELYIDVPVRRDRSELIADLVHHVTATQLQKPGGDGAIPQDDQRVLVLSGVPEITDTIDACIGDRDGVIRMDGFADATADAITPDMDGHTIYTSLDTADVVLSSTRYALADHVFHAMRTGDSDARPHSDRFFDSVVLVGAEPLTEPQFHFLRVLGDRIVAIGDTRRPGPQMVSGDARTSRLNESYFNRLYRRFANVENDDSQSLVVPAELPEPIADAFTGIDVTTTRIPGSVDFVDATGNTETALTETTHEYRVTCQDTNMDARFLRLEPAEEVDALQISHALDDLRTLDAGALTIQNEYTIQDIRFTVLTNNPIDGDTHQIEVNVPLRATPFLNRLLTHNPDEAATVAEICREQDPDVVVTPFAAHANTIRDCLGDESIPVRLPHELTGDYHESAVVSLGVSDPERIVSAPVSDIETLYTVLTAAKHCTIVGNRDTLERNSVLKALLPVTTA
ncbi:PD-(D/E)XK nuclease family protein [Natronobacterium texcoconense]|uniref:PD-(D/E)XK nuclease superfamily protein n=1 Tax=Natronobacterium texcoconense TaxID=1095778 RepID=A0A1H1AJ01_NATTX|nr:PD-(D/E)XK nuclease family protein [Natronobacterium texcoconense]SDQ39612.1 PD-(D/E)XK nuclease superfamily protein [Natronobacterium texcoconense]